MKSASKILSTIMLLYLLAVLLLQPHSKEPISIAQRSQGGGTLFTVPDKMLPLIEGPIVSEAVTPYISPAVKDLPLYEIEYHLEREINPRLNLNPNLEPNFRSKGGIDPLLAVQAGAEKQLGDGFTTPILNFDAQGFTGVNPPDTVGDVGPNHYIQIINSGGSGLMVIYNKNGTVLAGPTALASLGTGVCANGTGDGIVLYDRLAERWMISEFAPQGDNTLCVYISQSPDPVNDGWYAYQFSTPNFPDYPKYGVWPDAYYVSSNEDGGPAVYALDRNQMLTGGAATSQRFTPSSLSGFGFQALTPSDLDGATAPPAGSPNYFMRHRDDEVHNDGPDDADNDFLEIWAFEVDFDTPANSSFAKIADVEISEIDSDLCGLSSFFCFPQPGSSTTLDPLREVVMWRLQYRNFGSHEVLVGNLVTDVSGNDHGGIRWFELRKSGSDPWTLFQEGTFAPDEHHRWMGSIAMDGSGNMALGYSVSSNTVFPSIRYVGRLATDTAGTMPHGETSIIAGSAANSNIRWGDYSAMSVDPADDCTFWYTNMYNPSSNWNTRIATFKFDSCGEGSPTATPTATSTPGSPTASPTATSTPDGATATPTATSTPDGSTATATPMTTATEVPSGELACNGPAVGFEDGIPSNWPTLVTEGSVYWSTTADAVACDSDNGINQTGGSGFAACADSDQTNSSEEPYDIEMWTPEFSLSEVPSATLQFAAAYRDFDPSGGDHFQVDVWNGTSWSNVLNWNEDHFDPGELVEIDLSAYAGQSDVKVRFRYVGSSWDWWSQVDEVQLSCDETLTPTPSNTPDGPTPTPSNTPDGPTPTPSNTPDSPTLTPTPSNTPDGPTPDGTTIYLPLVMIPSTPISPTPISPTPISPTPISPTPISPTPLSLGLTPFDANLNDLAGPSSWSSNYGKSPEIIVSSNGVELDVLAQDYDSETAWNAVLLHIEPNSSGYEITQALTDMPMLDRVMGLATDDAGNRYYATGVDEDDIVDSTYPPLDTYRSNIVRVIKLNQAGDVQFNIDLDTARYAHNNNAEMIINPMVAATSRLAVGGNEIALLHGINTDPDWDIEGRRHQKALSTRLDATSGLIMRTSSVWVSHSFDQRLLYDGEGIIEHHLGDAYPRDIVFARDHTSYPLFHIKGELGENNTHTRLGNIALIENDSTYNYIALFATENSADTGGTINGPRNLAIVRVNGNDNSIDPSLPDTLTVTSIATQYTNRLRWLTDYSASSNLHAERPKLIGIGEDQYVVLWEEWLNSDTFNGLYAMLIDDKGNILRAATLITNQHHLHRGDDAFLLDNHAAWMTGNTVEQKLYIHLVDASLNYEIVTFDVGGD